MANWFINFLTQLFQIGMIIAIGYFIFLIGYALYKKQEKNKTLGIEDNTTGFVRKIVQFATFLAGKIK